jgi:hypothetical protein
MKRHVTFFAALLFAFAAQAQLLTIAISGSFVNVPENTLPPVITITYNDVPGAITTDVITPNEDGSFATSFTTLNTQGTIEFSYADCNNNLLTDSAGWFGESTSISLLFDACPGGEENPGGDDEGEFDILPGDSLNAGDDYDVIVIVPPVGQDSSYTWIFGDGNSSDEDYPVYTYTENGTYTLCLVVFDENQDTTIFCQTFTVDVSGGLINGGGAQAQGFTLAVFAEGTVGIAENDAITAMSVFPNPVTGDNLNVQLNARKAGLAEVQVLNAQGQLIRSTSEIIVPGAQLVETNVEGLPAGYYYLRFVMRDGSTKAVPFVR